MVSRTAHAGNHAVMSQKIPAGITGVPTASIRVLEQPASRPRHLDGSLNGMIDWGSGYVVVRCFPSDP